ncbi:MAG TPA: redoxin domain-containing protein [Candidatus Krumholzibacteria bacterium]|nr:redoxin domain-containing protein [Candidatus Krumholzibacteria bacterium]
MNKRTLFAWTMGMLVAGASLSGGITHAAGTQKTTPAAKPVASGTTLPAGANATEVYGNLTKEIEELSKQVVASNTPEDQMRIYSQIEGKLTAFRTKYPTSPEANDAGFQLGALNFGMQKYDLSAKFLNEYLTKVTAKDHEQAGFAHFYLAECYKAQGKYDLTEAEYKLILAKFSDVNQQLTQVTQANLDGLATEKKLAVGGEPVAFNVTSTDGKTLTPAAYKGKVLLIDFWATWCGPCVAEMPNVKDVYSKFHPQGFEIVGISLDQSRDRLDQYVKANQIAWPIYFDGKWWNNDVAVRYGIKSIPTTILVDKAGKIRYKSLRGKQLESAVQQLLAEK